jgi:mono/diheme cytochrome c family protein
VPLPRRTPRPLESAEESRQLDRWYIAGLLCMVALIIAFPVYNAGEPARRAEAQSTMIAENVAIGRTMFAQHCAACHGEEARGGRTAPTLSAREFLGSVSDRQLHWLISGGIPGSIMSAYDIDLGGPFTAQEISRLTAYLRSLEPGAPSVPGWFKGSPAPARRERAPDTEHGRENGGSPRSSERARGEQGARGIDRAESDDAARVDVAGVYASRCAACHGVAGEGSPIAPAVRPPRAALSAQPDRILSIVSQGVPGTAMAAFSTSQGGPLDDRTIRALVGWMRQANDQGSPGRE